MTPTRKWMARTVVALGGLATAVITSGWHQPEQIMAVTVVVAAVTSYLVPNEGSSS